ncbi:MAG: methyl-accepting chemotaxis protein [Gammaproteobacteria bacterium]|nr:methyl-accepting chemotaxis protein [Gammaproteobacteria bacterium]
MTDSTLNTSAPARDDFELYALRAAVEGASTPMMMINKDLVITHVNTATRRMMRQHEAVFKKHFPFIDIDHLVGVCIDDFHKRPEYQRRLLSDKRNFPWHGQIQMDDLLFEQNLNAIFDDKGELIGAVMEWREVSVERNHAWEVRALREDLDKLQAWIEFTPEGIILTANDNFLRSMGYRLDEVVGKHHRIFVNAEEEERSQYAEHWRRLAQGEIVTGLFQRIAKDGREIWLEGRYIPIKNDKGQVIRVIKIASDVTSRVQLQHLAEQLRASIDGANANLMYMDEHFRVFHLNPAMRTLLSRYGADMREAFPGLDPEAVLGASGEWLLRGESRLREVFANPGRMPYVFSVSFGGRYYNIAVSMIRGGKGQYLGNRIEFIDVTEQHQAEEQINRLIAEATRGELDNRIDTTHMGEGAIKVLSEGVNRLMDAIAAPIHAARETINALAEGDLTRSMEGHFGGEFARLQEALNASMENLKQMAMEIRATAQNITTASSEIRKGNHDLSRRTDQQASSLESTASAMEEITGTVKNNAENSARADKLANQTRTQAVDGRKIAERAIGAMQEINNASKKIADIIGVIDEIAFQTNLLALNAAVEAARAGEQGRGFAVVAAEVRNLAQRSASAAKEIKGLIKDSLEKVSDGSRLVDETGKMLDNINQSVAEVGDLIAQIATAGKEQAIGIEQINKALVKLDEMTQQNAALVEEAAAASASLDEQAQTLQGLVQFFKVEKEVGFGVLRRAVPAGTAASGLTQRAAANPTRLAHASPVSAGDDADWDQF